MANDFTLKKDTGSQYVFTDPAGSEIITAKPQAGKFYQFGDPTGKGGYEAGYYTLDPTSKKLVNIGEDFSQYQGQQLSSGGVIPSGLKGAYESLFADRQDFSGIDPTRTQQFIQESAQGQQPAGGVIDNFGNRAQTAEQLPQEITLPSGQRISPGDPNYATYKAQQEESQVPVTPIQAPKYQAQQVAPATGETLLTPTEFDLLRKVKKVGEHNFDEFFRRDEQGNIYWKDGEKRLYGTLSSEINDDGVQALARFHKGRAATAEELKMVGQPVNTVEDSFIQQEAPGGLVEDVQTSLDQIEGGGVSGAVGVEEIESDQPDATNYFNEEHEGEINTIIDKTLNDIKTEGESTLVKLMSDLQKAATASRKKAEEELKGTRSEYEKTLEDISGTSAVDDAFAQYEISDKINKLELVNQKIAQKEAELQLGLLTQEDKLAPMSIITRKQQRLKEIAAIDLGLLYANAQNIQGSINMAFNIANLKINEVTKNQDRQIQNYQFLLGLDNDNVVNLKNEERDYLKESIDLIQKEQTKIENKRQKMIELSMSEPMAWTQAGVSFEDTYEQALTKMNPFIVERQEKEIKEEEAKTKLDADYQRKQMDLVDAKIADLEQQKISDPNVVGSAQTGYFQYNPNTGKWNKIINPAVDNSGLSSKTITQIDKIRSEFEGSPITKNYNEVLNKKISVDAMVGLDSAGPVDLALVFEFMKALDPTSVVRESEYAAAAESGSIFKGLWTKFNGQFRDGEFLPDDVKKSFNDLVDIKFNAATSQYSNYRNEKARLIDLKTGEKDGLDYLPDFSGALNSDQNNPLRIDLDSDDPLKIGFNRVAGDTNEAGKIMQAIGQFESGDNYKAVGPETGKGKALGKYQIMEFNIPSWSREALGYQVSTQEFLNDPNIQDQIAEYKIAQYYNQYGNLQDVASMWFSGRPMARAGDSKDILGTTVPQYISNIENIYKNLV